MSRPPWSCCVVGLVGVDMPWTLRVERRGGLQQRRVELDLLALALELDARPLLEALERQREQAARRELAVQYLGKTENGSLPLDTSQRPALGESLVGLAAATLIANFTPVMQTVLLWKRWS